MDSFWNGSSDGSTNSATGYNWCSNARQCPWTTTEVSTNGTGARSQPITEDVVITGVFVWVDTAPGASKSWTFTFRDDSTDTAATFAISGASATSGSWTGTVAVAAGSMINLKCVPAGTPAASTSFRWYVTYRTAGNYYLILGGNGLTTLTNGPTNYISLQGGINGAITTTESQRQQVMPHGGTITKIAAASTDRSTVASGQGYSFSARVNATTDSDACVLVGTTVKVVQTITPFSFAAGDLVSCKIAATLTAAASRFGTCFTVVPDVPGETAVMYGANSAVSTSATQYEGSPAIGGGVSGWDATEANVNVRLPGGTLRKLYVNLATATGAAKSRAFTVRSNGSDTSLVATATNSATANDTTDAPRHNAGDLHSVKMVPTSTPAASASNRYGFVLAMDQVLNRFFAMY